MGLLRTARSDKKSFLSLRLSELREAISDFEKVMLQEEPHIDIVCICNYYK